jgi:hypothetical protein
MSQKSDRPGAGEQHVRDIRRATRRKYSSEEKIRMSTAEQNLASARWSAPLGVGS